MGSPIQLFVDTVLLGDPISRPTLKASTNYTGSYLVYGKDPGLDLP
jgi:glucan 1,3-beta-glucosidase